MQKLTIETESLADAEFLAAFLKKVSSVKKITIEQSHVFEENSETYNWTTPSRPATDKEIEEMLIACEDEFRAGLGMSTEQARALTQKKIAEWKKRKEL